MKQLLKIMFAFLLAFNSAAQNDRAFVIYNGKGKKVSYKKMKKAVLQQEFVFFGEYHDNPIAHWMELEIAKELFKVHGNSLQFGFEMFEQDQQMLLNEYLNGIVGDKTFEDSCRLWPNYSTDYKPLVMFAKQNKLFCLASNVPRRYASILFNRGRLALDSLSEVDKSFIAPLNFEIDTTLSQYAELKEMEQHMAGSYLLEAQALKDATMSHFILSNKRAENVFLHFNGAYHSDYHQGIVWYIQKALPEAKIITISVVTQENISKLEKENLSKADFILCIPESMTRTH
jgi:uncharacterized iron-regulated protein